MCYLDNGAAEEFQLKCPPENAKVYSEYPVRNRMKCSKNKILLKAWYNIFLDSVISAVLPAETQVDPSTGIRLEVRLDDGGSSMTCFDGFGSPPLVLDDKRLGKSPMDATAALFADDDLNRGMGMVFDC